MANRLSKVHDWYTKDARAFRRDLLGWYLGIPRVIVGLVVVLLISSFGLWIKRDHKTPWYETIFDNLESIALSSAGLIFLFEAVHRQQRDHYEAWIVINSAGEQTGSGGRIQALQNLNRDGVVLNGVSAPKANLWGIDLSNGLLSRANLQGAILNGANLERAFLDESNLNEASLEETNLSGSFLFKAQLAKANLGFSDLEKADLSSAQIEEADLYQANLSGANLSGANLREAKLTEAILCNTNLSRAILEEAYLDRANLEGAILRKANLKGTFLVGATLKGANLEGANLEGATIGDPIFKVTTILTDAALKNAILTNANLGDVKDLSRDQVYQAKLCRTNLPENIDLDPNRDCEELGINPETGEKNTYGSILGDLF